MSERKYINFMNVVEAVNTKTNSTFHFAVVRGLVVKLESKKVQANGEEKNIVTGSMAVNGRSKIINAALGTNYGDDETVWMNVTFWNSAERLMKYLEKSGNPDKVQMFVTGVISLNKYAKTDGSVVSNVRFMASDFNIVGNQSSATGNTSAAPATTTTPASTTAASEFSDDFDEDGFVDIDGSEDDLPF